MELLTKQVGYVTEVDSTIFLILNNRGGRFMGCCCTALCFSGLEQCLFHRICHYADKCNSGERKSQGAVWSQ